MIINTNIPAGKSTRSYLHDTIAYPSIESQVMGFIASHLTVTHEIIGSVLLFHIDGYRCSVEIKKDVLITVQWPEQGIRFGRYGNDYPSVRLHFNKDNTKKVEKFCNQIVKLRQLEKKAALLPKNVSAKKIESILKQKLETDRVTVSFWNDDNVLEVGSALFVCIHPKGKAPADGSYFLLENNKLRPFENTPIENAVGKDYGTDISSMKRKIEDVEQLKKKIDAFDVNDSPELLHFINVKKQANEIVKEFASL